jgi:hypothetical protein
VRRWQGSSFSNAWVGCSQGSGRRYDFGCKTNLDHHAAGPIKAPSESDDPTGLAGLYR